MSKYLVMKAVEHDKLPAKLRKLLPNHDAMRDAGYWMQRKYDGCMGIALITLLREQCEMVSRTGEKVRSCDHILDHLHAAAAQYGAFDDFAVIGEVWHPERPFPRISGGFRRHDPDTELWFVMNDMVGFGRDEDGFPQLRNTAMPYRHRYDGLLEFRNDGNLPPTMPVAITLMPNEYSNPDSLAQKWQDEGGYDGGILRNPAGGYTVGTVKGGEIVKIKPLLSLDLKIDAIYTEPGEKTGRPVHTIDVTYKGVTTRVGSGVPHDRNEFSIFDVVEVACLGLTEDGKLREPRFKGVRPDKLEADA